jgi:hypothetical protein
MDDYIVSRYYTVSEWGSCDMREKLTLFWIGAVGLAAAAALGAYSGSLLHVRQDAFQPIIAPHLKVGPDRSRLTEKVAPQKS